MIALNSVFLDHRSREKVFNDAERGKAVSELNTAGMSMTGIGTALNSTQGVLTRLLLSAAPWHQEQERIFAPDPELRFLPDPAAPQTLRGIRGERDRVTVRLAQEISSWLRQFEIHDNARMVICLEAKSLLSSSGLDADGCYVFSADRAVAEVLAIWRPAHLDPWEADIFGTVNRLGAWLAAWLRFWVVDPKTWTKALNLSVAAFRTKKQPMAA
jgi:hypothetical protein